MTPVLLQDPGRVENARFCQQIRDRYAGLTPPTESPDCRKRPAGDSGDGAPRSEFGIQSFEFRVGGHEGQSCRLQL